MRHASIAQNRRRVIFSHMKSALVRILFFALPVCAIASNSVVNLSHYDPMRPDFVAMKSEGVIGIIHEATFPRFDRDGRYYERQNAALQSGLLWGAYHYGDGTDPVRQADHFLNVVAGGRPISTVAQGDPESKRPGVLLVLDFEQNTHYRGGSMTTAQAAAFVQHIKERTGKYPGLYCSEYRLRQMLYGNGSAAHRAILSNCWLWIANYHFQPRNTAPWDHWHLWQYTGDGKCELRPRGQFPISVGNMRKAERNIFNGNNVALQAFWQEHAWFPNG
jgi:lysozyme